MRKLLTFLLVGLCVLSGCGNNDSTTPPKQEEEKTEPIKDTQKLDNIKINAEESEKLKALFQDLQMQIASLELISVTVTCEKEPDSPKQLLMIFREIATKEEFTATYTTDYKIKSLTSHVADGNSFERQSLFVDIAALLFQFDADDTKSDLAILRKDQEYEKKGMDDKNIELILLTKNGNFSFVDHDVETSEQENPVSCK